MAINRRKMLGGTGLVGAGTLGGVTAGRMSDGWPHPQEQPVTDDAARFGNPRIPAELGYDHSHLFRLGAIEPTVFDGGHLQQAHENNFPILTGQEASIVLVTLEPGGIREPHWHPSAWEINIITGGVATWTLLDPLGNAETFDARPGDVVFAPQGSLHYFENKTDEDMSLIIVFNASTEEGKDDIGIGASISKLPPDVLGAVFGVPAETFSQFKKIDKSITITKRA